MPDATKPSLTMSQRVANLAQTRQDSNQENLAHAVLKLDEARNFVDSLLFAVDGLSSEIMRAGDGPITDEMARDLYDRANFAWNFIQPKILAKVRGEK